MPFIVNVLTNIVVCWLCVCLQYYILHIFFTPVESTSVLRLSLKCGLYPEMGQKVKIAKLKIPNTIAIAKNLIIYFFFFTQLKKWQFPIAFFLQETFELANMHDYNHSTYTHSFRGENCLSRCLSYY